MKIFYSDIDGTLLNKQHMVSDLTLKSIKDWTDQGNRFVISSGRPLPSILGIIGRCQLEPYVDYIIAQNGCLVYDVNQSRAIFERTLPYSLVKQVFQVAKKHGIHCHTYTDTHVVSKEETKALDYYTSRIKMPFIISDNIASVLVKEPYKVLTIELEHPEILPDFRKNVMSQLDGQITSVFSNKNFLEFFHPEGGKGNAVEYLSRYLNTDISDTYAAGDAENDLSMLEAAGHSIVMLNAEDTIKETAEIITEYDYDHDGLAYCINHLLNN